MGLEFVRQFGETITLIVVFVAFFWIMKKFAWAPILKTIDDRQKNIEDGFEEIKRLKTEAEEAHKRYEAKLRDIETEARNKIQEAINDGRRVAAEITEHARHDANEITEKAKANMQLEVASARKQLRDDVIQLTLTATEKLINERLNEAKDRELVGSFIDQMEKGQ
jgi:F-type H+-transporting ATPase subunit b